MLLEIREILKGKKILITGASGYLASHLIKHLNKMETQILCLSRQSSGDLCQIATWEPLLEGTDFIFHFASQTSVLISNANPEIDWRSNVLPLVSLLEACKKTYTKPAIVFAGSATQVGLNQTLCVNELTNDKPVTTYDLHKLMAEHYLELYTRLGYVKGVTLRLANVYGPGPKSGSADRGILNRMILRSLAGEAITIYGNGTEVRDYIYIEDVVQAFLATAPIIEKISGQHFLIGSGQGRTLLEAFKFLANRVEVKTGKQTKILHVPSPNNASPIDSRSFVADSSRFKAASGWVPEISFAEGVDLTIDDYLI
jgi:UDP-glucose 4-epimerase